jgi:hypothetical protein
MRGARHAGAGADPFGGAEPEHQRSFFPARRAASPVAIGLVETYRSPPPAEA